jgi:NlpC/P60 family putative phage cell wall peptidase
MTARLGIITRARVVAEARTWIGTPYHHQASLRGIGTDCIGLVLAVCRTFDIGHDGVLPAYSRDWAEATGTETLLAAAHRHLVSVSPSAALPGDVLIFRYRAHAVAKHAGFLATSSTFIHALENAPVSEVALSGWWKRRIVGVFRIPGIID